jgi:hypothetical protein
MTGGLLIDAPHDYSSTSLSFLLPLLSDLWGIEVTLSPGPIVLGPVPFAGARTPLPSSAAQLRAGGHQVWIPAPLPGDGPAAEFLHAGRLFVLPTVRLFEHAPGKIESASSPEYLGLADWLTDALKCWRFVVLGSGEGVTEAATVLDCLREQALPPEAGLGVVARIIWFALLGARTAYRCRVDKAELLIPARPMWLRPVFGTTLARRAARALVTTAWIASRASDQGKGCVPLLAGTARGYRIDPTVPHDWGIDPVHSPEGPDIRLTGRLADGVRIENRKLVFPRHSLPLSVSTRRLPFAGYNDPRRLLMAANMQVHSVPVVDAQPPLVHQGPGIDPPGVNLRVGYLAWQGWNHEDAWVLSESAARRLGGVEEHVQTMAIRAVELPPRWLVEVGADIRPGQLLLERRAAPALLAPSLEQLARLRQLDEAVVLEPEPGDHARQSGTVVKLEMWDLLTGENIPADWHVPRPLSGSYRSILRAHIRRELPLAIGDKLANRHGHKGIVGAILADDQMPQWQGHPLEALLDPISVLNRSNWGQVYETLAGADGAALDVSALSGEEIVARAMQLGADSHGRWPISPPLAGSWLKKSVWAVAGVQFVMRQPHHACDRLKDRPQRFGEMDHWAFWAHGLSTDLPAACGLAPPARRLQRLLAAAGFGLTEAGHAVRIERLGLHRDPPAGSVALRLEEHTLPELYDAVDAVAPEAPTALVFDPPLPALVGKTLRWLPIVPPGDRPARQSPDGAQCEHELTLALRAVLRAAHYRQRRRHPRRKLSAEQLDLELHRAVTEYMSCAFTFALGQESDTKGSWLRRGVLGHRLPCSGRAVAAPAGTLGLGLDEVGLPSPLCRMVLGLDGATDEEALARAAQGRWIWIKRDPVLHRWGLLPVRFRPISENVIRLPASLLGPMGADFDGDTIAVFATLPGMKGDLAEVRPSRLAWDAVLQRPLFVPGKQYLFGLSLVGKDRQRLQALQQELHTTGAPAWPVVSEAKPALEQWVGATGGVPSDGGWWEIVERHALDALATDPGMGLGLYSAEEWGELDVIRCGAAKAELYAAPNRAACSQILHGESFAGYHLREASAPLADPIADVMLAAKESVGRFGGVLRRLLFSCAHLTPTEIRAAQALTEQATQRVLSIKAGRRPMPFAGFDVQVRRLLRGEKPQLPAEPAELNELLERAAQAGVWEILQAAFAHPVPVWLQWLREPHRLAELLDGEPTGFLEIPLTDLRSGPWQHG